MCIQPVTELGNQRKFSVSVNIRGAKHLQHVLVDAKPVGHTAVGAGEPVQTVTVAILVEETQFTESLGARKFRNHSRYSDDPKRQHCIQPLLPESNPQVKGEGTMNGFLVVNKPEGPSSGAVVARLKYLLLKHGNMPKKGPGRLVIGHGGTLDPLACGLLPIGLGKATKKLQALLEGPKTYQFTVQWGTATTTDDREGAPTGTSESRPTAAQIAAVLPQFTGLITQTPPAYSALKVDGQRAYQLARKGADVALQPREVTIHTLTLRENTNESATFVAEVSKGTYIRTLGKDIALALGTVGHITFLQRTAHGPFTLQDAVDYQTLDIALQKGDSTPYLRPLDVPPEGEGQL